MDSYIPSLPMTPRTRRARQPIALTIAGSDSGGGAGLQADLKTFLALGVHGTTVVTCVTAQNPAAVTATHPTPPAVVLAQLEALHAELPPAAAKTGMLFDAGIIRAVSEFWAERHPRRRGGRKPAPLVVDPVMIATSGARLLQPDAIDALTGQLIPQATLLTPNVDELAALLGRPVAELASIAELRCAARELRSRFGCAVLAKGGHLHAETDATDIFWDGREELMLTAPRIRGVTTHGTGCTYAAAITGYLALGCRPSHAVQLAKEHVTQAIDQSVRIGRHQALNPLWR